MHSLRCQKFTKGLKTNGELSFLDGNNLNRNNINLSGYSNKATMISEFYCFCCWLPDPFWGMEAWRKTMETQKPGNSPGSGPEVVERQRVAKEWAAQRVRSWTVQNAIRGVLGRVSARAAGRILDSANPREIRT